MSRSAIADRPDKSSKPGTRYTARLSTSSSVTSRSSTSVGDGLLDLEPDGGLEPAAHQLALQRLQQVLRDVLVDLQVADPGHPEHVMLQDVQTDEQLAQVRGDHVLQRHEPVRSGRQEPRQQRRHLHPGENGLP